jgi:hypothetical protein
MMFGVLLLLAPFAGLLPFSGLLPSSTQTFVTTDTKTLNYNVASTETYFGSTSGITTIQSPLNLPPRGIGFIAPEGKCAQFSVPISITSGTTLNLAMTSSKPANLYLLPGYTFQPSPDGCNIIGNTILSETNFTAYNLHWTAPENGTFYLIFTGPTTIIILMNDGSTKPIQQMANVTYASSTETTSWSDPSTSTTIYTITTPVASPLYLRSVAKYALPIEVGLLILTITTIALTLHRRRNP